jgi:hypothetical protein
VAGRPREVARLDIKGYVVDYSPDPQSDQLRKDYLRFVNVLMSDKTFADLFEGEVLMVGDRFNPNLSSSAGAKGELLPKAGLEFEVILTFKPPPAAPGRP